MARDTSISLQPASGSGTTAPTRIVRDPNVIEPPTSRSRSFALAAPRTASPERSADVTSARTSDDTNGPYAAGSTENASIGISKGGVGRSTTEPSAACDDVIQRVSPAPTPVVPSDGALPPRAGMPAGSEPVIQASQASRTCAAGRAPVAVGVGAAAVRTGARRTGSAAHPP